MGNVESLFDRTLVNLGDIKVGSKHKVMYEYTGDLDMIEDIVSGCGCSKAKIDGGNISVEYTDNNTGTVTKESPAKQFTRIVEVFFKDGRPLKKPNERGELVHNSDKTRVKLQFIGTAVL